MVNQFFMSLSKTFIYGNRIPDGPLLKANWFWQHQIENAIPSPFYQID
jgi:hypothetical protein